MERIIGKFVTCVAMCCVTGLALQATAQAPAQTPPAIDLATVGAICSGASTATLPGGQGQYTEKNGYTFEYNTNKELEVKRSGVLLYKIDKFTQAGMTDCIVKIVAALSKPPIPEQRACRTASNGIERYAREFDIQRNSPEMSGGHSQPEWCNTMIISLRGEHPLAEFLIVNSTEFSRSGCAPFNCPLYTYSCTVHVKTDPIYFEKVNPDCSR